MRGRAAALHLLSGLEELEPRVRLHPPVVAVAAAEEPVERPADPLRPQHGGHGAGRGRRRSAGKRRQEHSRGAKRGGGAEGERAAHGIGSPPAAGGASHGDLGGAGGTFTYFPLRDPNIFRKPSKLDRD